MQDLNDKITGGTLTAAEWNQVPSELQNVIESLGITLSGGDLNQLNKAIAGYASHGNFYTETGAADAYVLSPTGAKVAPPAYVAGFTARFIAGNVNTGASTINVATLGVKAIKDQNGNALTGGEINGSMAVEYDGTDFLISGPGVSGSNLVVFTAGGSYSKPAGLISVKVTVVGGGAGGGASNSAASRGGGGGAGSPSVSHLLASELSASETVTVGSGGAGGLGSPGVGDDGTTGGSSSLGGHVIAPGGTFGEGAATNVGGAGGVAGTGDITTGGGFGSDGSSAVGSGSGDGGASYFGGGGRSGDPVGQNALAYGAGGGSAVNGAQAGNGFQGVVIIEEIF